MADKSKRQETIRSYQTAANKSLAGSGFSPWLYIQRKLAEFPLQYGEGAPTMPLGVAQPEVSEYEAAAAGGYPSLDAYRLGQQQAGIERIAPAMQRLKRPKPLPDY